MNFKEFILKESIQPILDNISDRVDQLINPDIAAYENLAEYEWTPSQIVDIISNVIRMYDLNTREELYTILDKSFEMLESKVNIEEIDWIKADLLEEFGMTDYFKFHDITSQETRDVFGDLL